MLSLVNTSNLNLTNLSPLDGRYAQKLNPLREYFSELALQKYRCIVELSYLVALGNEKKIAEVKPLTDAELKIVENLINDFSEKDGQRIKSIEAVTNHDVKAIEYFLREKLEKTSLKKNLPFIHFALTSEDVNNLAYALMHREALRNVLSPRLKELMKEIEKRAKAWKNTPLLSRTHGQTATPTTVGKEFFVFSTRLERKIKQLEKQEILGKLSGATGTFAAQLAAYPQVDWESFSKKFIKSLGLIPNLATTQIESHDWNAELYDTFRGVNNILIDLARDCWSYISLDYFKLKKKEGEVGSSTMPHKVNPIDFENAEGNFGVANALLSFFSDKLPISRLQRDLTDSTVLRNCGVALGHSLLGWDSLSKGLGKLEINAAKLAKDLEENPEVLGEAVQTVLRKFGDNQAYEKLKNLTRGKKLTLEILREFIATLPLPPAEKKALLQLTPAKYIGLAAKLVKGTESPNC
ncbi:MAG: adenylosuccinate lyase [Candidatus Gracilibacteria bacterium]|nr:adenylosuccinate lyase [Candidatus Gracilibacteria bacterium]